MVLNIKISCLWICNLFLTYSSSPLHSELQVFKVCRFLITTVAWYFHIPHLFSLPSNFNIPAFYVLSTFPFHCCTVCSAHQYISFSLTAQRAFISASSLLWKHPFSVHVHFITRNCKQQNLVYH